MLKDFIIKAIASTGPGYKEGKGGHKTSMSNTAGHHRPHHPTAPPPTVEPRGQGRRANRRSAPSPYGTPLSRPTLQQSGRSAPNQMQQEEGLFLC